MRGLDYPLRKSRKAECLSVGNSSGRASLSRMARRAYNGRASLPEWLGEHTMGEHPSPEWLGEHTMGEHPSLEWLGELTFGGERSHLALPELFATDPLKLSFSAGFPISNSTVCIGDAASVSLIAPLITFGEVSTTDDDTYFAGRRGRDTLAWYRKTTTELYAKWWWKESAEEGLGPEF